MKYGFDKKQKIIIIGISIIVIIVLLYYIYTKKDENIIIEESSEKNVVEEITEAKEEEKNTIFIHISGAINKEGVIELEENSRVSDAIAKAEELKENASIKNINLAYKLEDGMKIYIPTIEEEQKQNEIDETSKYITSSTEGIQKQGEETNQKVNEKVNINTATQTELETLPGIGPSTSLKIVNYRKENGKFESIEEIKEVSGIGEVKYENIKELICVE